MPRHILAAVGALSISCTFPRTQTIVEIRADSRVMNDANELRFEVLNRAGETLIRRDLYPQASAFPGFPILVPVSAKGGDDTHTFEVRVVATNQRRASDGSVTTTPIASNRIRTGFRRGAVLRATLWLLTGCRCNEETERCEPAGNGDPVPECVPIELVVPTSDAGMAREADMSDSDLPDASTTCTSEQSFCGGQCVSRFSPLSCGANCAPCAAIPGGVAACDGSQCSIACNPTTPERCPTACVDLASDSMNCGACGRSCMNGQICVNRVCVAPPQCAQSQDPTCTGLTYCNLATRLCAPGCDGRQGQCPTGTTCSTETHACECAAGTQLCGASCVTCPTGADITSTGCSGNACVVTRCADGHRVNEPGTGCEDINECLTQCASPNTCTNTAGSFVCTCAAPNRTCGGACVTCPSGSNVATTDCSGNMCIVTSCTPGFTPNAARTSCVTAVTGFRWRQLSVTGPPARTAHAMVWDPVRNRIVLFGGYDGNSFRNDTWIFDGSSWGQVQTATSPAARYSHAMVWDAAQNRIVLFGGWGSGGTRNDTWVFDGSTWSQTQTATTPPARYGHAMIWDAQSSRVVLFGGTNNNFFDDTWTFDGSTWARIATATEPRARDGHAMVWDSQSNRIVLFGGGSGRINPNTFDPITWVFGGSNWGQLQAAALPSARWGSAMVWDSQRNRALLFGGEIAGNGSRDETWTYEGSNWSRFQLATAPAERRKHAMVWDSQRNRAVLFGGENTIATYRDTWVFEEATP